MEDMDFPLDPTVGQTYTAPASGVVYEWDGRAWIVGEFDTTTQEFGTIGDIINQIRILLQDTDPTGTSGYRYSTASIILCVNQGMLDLYRMRPDIFLELRYQIPQFVASWLEQPMGIEMQYVSPLVFYAVGLVQARDDEQTQDARAAAFLQTFKGAVLTVS